MASVVAGLDPRTGRFRALQRFQQALGGLHDEFFVAGLLSRWFFTRCLFHGLNLS